jgi:hypothetical protein
MRVFIFANNETITEEFIKKLDIKHEDILVLMNSQTSFKFLGDYKSNQKYIFLRSGFSSYWGQELLDKTRDKYNVIVAIGKGPGYKATFFKKPHRLILNKEHCIFDEDRKELPYDVKYPRDDKTKYESTGYIVYHYIKHKFPNHHIILVKFTAYIDTIDIGVGPASCHNYKFEQEYYKNNKIKIIN